MKAFLKNITVLVAALALAIACVWGVGELILRRIVPHDIGDREELYAKSPNKALNKELKPGYEGLYFGGAVKINRSGLRDYDYPLAKPEGTYRIAVLGDSMSFGHGLKLEDIYAKKLESFLNTHKPVGGPGIEKVEVINFAVPGYNTAQEFEVLKEKALRYGPDLVIMNFFPNDVLPTEGAREMGEALSGSELAAPKGIVNKIDLARSKSYFAQYIFSHIAMIARRFGIRGGYISAFQGVYEDKNEGWIACRRCLLKAKGLCERNNADFLVVIIPFLSDLNEHHPLLKEMETVSGFCGANGIDSLDLFPYFKGRRSESLWVSPIDGHPNARAHGIMARAVGEYILDKWKSEDYKKRGSDL